VKKGKIKTLDYGHHKKDLSLYVHIPFCDLICPYCDFNKYANVDHMIVDFTSALSAEIKSVSEKFKNYSIKSIFFGGGTPSYLDEYSLNNIYEQINSSYDIDPKVEFSIEVNPTDLNEKKLKLYESIGVNRISLGGQSFEDEILIKLGRNHNSKDLETSLNILQDSYIKNINLDLIFGVPDQTIEHWKKTLDKFLSYSLPHLSAYCLTFEPKTKYFRDLKLNKIISPPENLLVKMFNYNTKTLPKSNYEQYEISNWAQKSFKSKHNLRYWQMKNYRGFGPGASSHVEGTRTKNIRSLKSYIKVLMKEEITEDSFIQETNKNTFEDTMSEYIMLNLRLSDGISHQKFFQRFGYRFELRFENIISELKKASLFETNDKYSKLTNNGKLVSDEISRKLLQEIN